MAGDRRRRGVWWRWRRTRRRRSAALRRRQRRHRPPLRGRLPVLRRRRGGRVRLRRRRAQRAVLRRRQRAGRALPQREPDRRGVAVHAAAVARHRPDRRSRVPIRSTSTATGTPTSRCCASARTSSCAGSATAGSSGPTRRSASTAATRGPSRSARRGRASNDLPTLAFGDYLGRRSRVVRGQPAAPARRRRRAVRRAGRPDARLLHAVDAVQRLEPVRAGATCG